VQNLVLPFYDLTRGTSRFSYGHVLRDTQWWRRKEIYNLQNRNLRALLKHTYETVPYFRKIFKERKLTPGDIKTSADLNRLPQLTKQDIQKRSGELVSVGYDKSRLIPCQSGGSEKPIRFFITRESCSWELAAESRAYSWAGYRLGDRCFMFWGSPLDLTRAGTIIRKVNQSLERILIAGTFVLSDRVFEESAQALRKFRPKIIRGYASSVFMMAKYLNYKHICDVRPKAVITSAETLQDSMRETIQEAFDCPVFDYYGSREIGAIAAECEEHSGYHISAENVIVEFVEGNEAVQPGERGVILVTSLRNFGMPFIRYRIGDVGIPAADGCQCGRGLPLMSSIEGRISDFMASYDESHDRIIPVGPIYPVVVAAIMHLPVENFRVVQESLDRLTVRVVKSKGYADEDTDRLLNHMKKYLGSSTKIEIEFVDSIPPLPSGKRAVFVSKIDPFESRRSEIS
jgi:phenylacetate-CoA ligase